ncbi:hypothetical protein GCM10010975_14570 [Comamonas phosphati]|nr:hypothetical protein GCM10010975_14570 [Comamonas phosphati]
MTLHAAAAARGKARALRLRPRSDGVRRNFSYIHDFKMKPAQNDYLTYGKSYVFNSENKIGMPRCNMPMQQPRT